MPNNQKVIPLRSRVGRHGMAHSDKRSLESRLEAILHPNKPTPRLMIDNIASVEVGLDPEIGEVGISDTGGKTLTVLVADDHPVVREGLASLIDRQPDMLVVDRACNGREAMEKFMLRRPDVALIDLRMPVMDGIDAVMAICESDPSSRIAIITSYQSEEDVYRALRAGALGFILKDATPDELAGCLHAVALGNAWIPPQVGAMLAKRVAERELTRRETSVLQQVAAGKSNKEIGVAFDISEATVKVHMTHILEKLKVGGRTEAINVAVKKGLVRLDLAAVA